MDLRIILDGDYHLLKLSLSCESKQRMGHDEICHPLLLTRYRIFHHQNVLIWHSLGEKRE